MQCRRHGPDRRSRAPPVHGSPCPTSTVPAFVSARSCRVTRLRARSSSRKTLV